MRSAAAVVAGAEIARLGEAAVTVIGLVTTLVSPLLLSSSVYPVPTLFSVSPENVATPSLAFTESVPPSFAPPALLSSADLDGAAG